MQTCNNHKDFFILCTVVKLKDEQILIKLCNPTNNFVTLKKEYNLGYLEEVNHRLNEECAANDESNCNIHKCSSDMEDKVEGDVESPLKATPVDGTWTDENSTGIGAFFVWYLEEVMKDVPDHVKDLYKRSRVILNEE